ncbi:BrnT family toxin [Acinetobacter puyangensis]|uniref:BrnT family toxin n=1 Tax=Acinetobacter puyangensis TaxID=1096779 RepID=UPI003A4D4645
MRFIWDEINRQKNLQKHGLDFADVEVVFDQPLVLFEDTLINYGEQRMVAIGLLQILVVVIVHIEDDNTIRIISMRKATHNETDIYYQNI